MNEWEICRHQVAIGGVVSDRNIASVDALVSVARSDGTGHAQQTRSRFDGSFFFLDLADAEYAVAAKSVGRTATAAAHVQRKPDQSLPMSWLHLQLE